MTKPCPICDTEIDESKIMYTGDNTDFYPCPTCENFDIYRPYLEELPKEIKKYRGLKEKIQKAIKEHPTGGNRYFIDRTVVKKLLFEI
ncbi:hypothetical protein [Desulfosarcina widdelii]|nr:hypothetical protein [Desulfosarcina widdelii]